MIVYFDESYDTERRYLLYGALFVPPGSTLHQRFLAIRREMNYRPEVKYTKCRNKRALSVCTRVIDEFISDSAYFRCVVVDQHRFDYTRFAGSHESRSVAQARAYKKFAEMLLHPNLKNVTNAVFLADDLKRCDGDSFLERSRERFNPEGRAPTFRHLAEVPSNVEEYQCVQVCDLLLGCVLNNLKPSNPYKNRLREHLLERLRVQSFLMSAWRDVPLSQARDPAVKFNVWHWSAKKRPR
jgi:hypothetical protein